MTIARAMFSIVVQQVPPTVDYTPAFIGLAGALTGALIGLQFNLWSHRTERKRHIREKVALLMEQTDVVHRFYREEMRRHENSPFFDGKKEDRNRAIEEALRKLDAAMDEARRVLGYLGLTDQKVWYAAQLLFDAAYDIQRVIPGWLRDNSPYSDPMANLRNASQLYDRVNRQLVELVGQTPPHPLGPTITIRKFTRWSARKLNAQTLTAPRKEKADAG